ncbi:MAG: NAD+ synthase [Caldisericia bacterium]|jgi:NAD+ synthase|nr:NAD+ synthase [Caldisericia bacterium]
MVSLKINLPFTRDLIISFIKEESEKIGLKKGIIAISSGIDSTLVSFLSTLSLGKENLVLVNMPYGKLGEKGKEDSIKIASELGVPLEIIDIKNIVDSYFKEDVDKIRKGNFMARVRMAIVFDISKRENGFVIGCSNKSELLVGYSTWYGDMAASILPIGDLYKTQVWELAKFVGVPDYVLKKVPSAELWEGQTDEGEMGITYNELDQILYLLVDKRMKIQDIVKEGFDIEKVKKVKKMVINSHFKRRLPPIPKISDRTVGIDYLYFRDYKNYD